MDRTFTLSRSPRGTAVIAICGVALLLVGVLTWEAWRSERRRQDAALRTLKNLSTVAATNYAMLVTSFVSSHASVAFENAGVHDGPRLLARLDRLLQVTDSLHGCRCDFDLRTRAILVMDDSGRVIAERPSGGMVRDTLRRLPALLRSRVNRRAESTTIPFLTYDTAVTHGALLAIGVFHDSADHPPSRRYVALAYDSATIAQDVIARLAERTSMILPRAVFAVPNATPALALRVRRLRGAQWFDNGVTFEPTNAHEQVLTMDSTLLVSTSVLPSVAAPLLGLADDRGVGLLSSILALGIAAAVLATGLMAWRNLQLARMRSQFAASLSHELRTPLTEIMLYAELVEMGRTPSSGLRDAGRLIRSEAQRLQHMVENALHLARADRRLVQVSPTSQPVRPILEGVAAGFQLIAEQKGVRIAVQGAPSLCGQLDAYALRQVLLNLLDNAVRYGPDDQCVALRVAEDVGNAQVRIEVDDAGPGIPVAERGRIWQAFTRLPRDVQRARSGTGLGLRIVHELVGLMGGSVTVETSSRGGARFVVRLPRGADVSLAPSATVHEHAQVLT
ncbi:MAG: HAMP domain-containing sensor histidine kinase [Gemmatimonadaceae bacterium]